MPSAELSPDQPCWQIQARKRTPLVHNVACGSGHANQWTPVCVERADSTPSFKRSVMGPDEEHAYRPYHYVSYEAALAAFKRYLEIEDKNNRLMGCYGGQSYTRLLDVCEIRFVQVGPVVYSYHPHTKELNAAAT